MAISYYRKRHAEAVKDFRYIIENYGRPDTADMYERLESLALDNPTYEEAWLTVVAMIRHTYHGGYNNSRQDSVPLPVDDDKELQRIKERWID